MKRRLLRICALVGAMTLGLSAAAQEHIDMLAATQSYTANLTIFNSLKTLATKALTIGQ